MIVRRNSSAPDACSNCGEAIGRLETPHIWNQHIVCARCQQKLEADAPTPSTAAIPTIFSLSPEAPAGNYRGMARAAMIVSIFGLVCFGFITGVLAIILGGIAWNGMARTGNKDGEEWAQAAIVIGAIDFVVWLVIAFVWVHDTILVPNGY